MHSEDIQHIFISGEDQVWSSMCGILWHRHHKGLSGCNFAIMSYFFDGSYPDGMDYGRHSFLQDIALLLQQQGASWKVIRYQEVSTIFSI